MLETNSIGIKRRKRRTLNQNDWDYTSKKCQNPDCNLKDCNRVYYNFVNRREININLCDPLSLLKIPSYISVHHEVEPKWKY